jgi:hypothetical protein
MPDHGLAIMKMFWNWFWVTVSMALMIHLAGCSTSNGTSAGAKAAFASPSLLTATLTNGNSIVLRWKNNATAEGGLWVEYAQPDYVWFKLDAFPSDKHMTSFVHPDLAPQTVYMYHILPFFGQPTGPVEITTGIAASTNLTDLVSGPIDSTNRIPSGEHLPKYSIRKLQTFAMATPTDLTATLSSPTSVDLHWKDQALGEDGYFLEVSRHPAREFVPCALLPAKATSFRKTGLPPETKCYFRVRAFFYGKPSNQASVTMP